MEFFARVFETLADWSSRLPAVEFKTYFIVVLAIIAGVGLITGLTYFASAAYKLKKADKKIIKYLSETDAIDDDNASDFTSQCFSAKAPQRLRDAWVQYLGVRYGYPSDIVSERDVFDKEVKKAGNLRANVFIGVALILLAVFAFWGFGTLKSNEMGVLHCLGLLFAGVIYLVLVIIGKRQYKKTLENFYIMQEDLDAKVNLQVEKNYATDSSPLIELGAMVDEIIARNTAKIVEISDEMNASSTDVDGDEEAFEEAEPLEDELLIAETPIEELISLEESKTDVESLERQPRTEEISDTCASEAEDAQTPLSQNGLEDAAEQSDYAVCGDDGAQTLDDVAEIVVPLQETTDAVVNEEDFENTVEQLSSNTDFEPVETEQTDTDAAGTEPETTPDTQAEQTEEPEQFDTEQSVQLDSEIPDEEDVGDSDLDEADGQTSSDDIEAEAEEDAIEQEQEQATEAEEDFPDVWASAFAPRKKKNNTVKEETPEESVSESDAKTDEPSDAPIVENETEAAEGKESDAEALDAADALEDDDTALQADEEITADAQSADYGFQEYGEASDNTDLTVDNEEIAEGENPVPDDTDNNGEVDLEMFGKKKNHQNVQAEAPVAPLNEDLFVEGELIKDEEDFLEAEILEDAETVVQEAASNEQPVEETPAEADEQQPEEIAEEIVEEESEPEVQDVEEEAETVDAEASEEEPLEEAVEEEAESEETETLEDETDEAAEDASEEVVYIVDGPEEDDEFVKPAKLVKLPHLVDYMIAMDMSKPMKIKVATMLLSTYNAFKDIPEDKSIVIKCIAKLLATFNN